MDSQTKQTIDFKQLNDTDWDFSDEALQKIENYMSGNASTYVRDGGREGWDFTTDTRNYDGTAPGRYEITGKKLKKNFIK